MSDKVTDAAMAVGGATLSGVEKAISLFERAKKFTLTFEPERELSSLQDLWDVIGDDLPKDDLQVAVKLFDMAAAMGIVNMRYYRTLVGDNLESLRACFREYCMHRARVGAIGGAQLDADLKRADA